VLKVAAAAVGADNVQSFAKLVILENLMLLKSGFGRVESHEALAATPLLISR
jgi:hypothetical protein